MPRIYTLDWYLSIRHEAPKKEIAAWASKMAMKNFFLYKSKGKRKVGKCTACKTEMELCVGKNRYTECPTCGQKIKAVENKDFTHGYDCFVSWLDRYDGFFLNRTFRVFRRLYSSREELHIEEAQMQVFKYPIKRSMSGYARCFSKETSYKNANWFTMNGGDFQNTHREHWERGVCGDIVHTFNSAGECTGCGAEYSYNLDATFATKYLKYQDRGSYYEVTGIQTQFVDGVGYKYGESVIIVIPETYNGKPVKSIAPMAFANVDDNENGGVCIKKVYLYGCSSGLNVGYQAFTANDFLTDIYLSGTINFTDDNPYASYENTVAQLAQFRGNKNLSNVIIAEGTELKIVLSDGVESVSSSLQIFSEAGNRVVNVLGEEVEITLLGKTFPTISKGFFGGLATCKVLYSEGMTIPATSDNWLPKEGNGSSGTVIVEVGLPNVSNNILEGFSAPTAELGYYPESNLGRSYYFAEWTFCLPNAAAYVEKEDFAVNFVIVSADSYRKLGMGAERLFGENAVYTPYDTDLDPNSDWYITPGCSDIKLYLSKDTWSDGNLLCTVSMRAWEDFTVYHSGLFGTGEQDLEHPDTIRTSMDIVCIPYVYMDGEYYFAQVEGSDCFKSFKTIVSEYLAEHSSDLSEEVIADIKDDFGLDDDENAAA